jgi:biotin carboxyl carrier protein
MESMKLETVISAWRDGIVAQVNVEVGSAFDRGSVLVALEEEA